MRQQHVQRDEDREKKLKTIASKKFSFAEKLVPKGSETTAEDGEKRDSPKKDAG